MVSSKLQLEGTPYPASTAELATRHKIRHKNLFDWPHEYPISKSSFVIPGLGKQGPNCGAQRADKFASDGSKLHYKTLRCKRIECPVCWGDWARHVVFGMALKIEAHARKLGKRPHLALFSVNPESLKEGWTWERVNTSLFRRGYRRVTEHGIDGGYGVFHPYRIQSRWKTIFREHDIDHGDDNHEDIGFWKDIRRRVQEGTSLMNFVKLGPHIHAIMFGTPKAHECKDYLIRFKDDGHGNPIALELEDIVGLLFYLVTHTGVISHMKPYLKHRSSGFKLRKELKVHKARLKGLKNLRELTSKELEEFYELNLRITELNELISNVPKELKVRKQLTHTIRAWGSMHHIDVRKEIGEDDFNNLAAEIAGMLGMGWDPISGSLCYLDDVDDKESHKELATGVEWVPIWQLGSRLNDEYWLTKLSETQRRFWFAVHEFMNVSKRPPDYREIEHPPDVEAILEKPPRDVEDLAITPKEIAKAPRQCKWARGMCDDLVASRCPMRGATVCPRSFDSTPPWIRDVRATRKISPDGSLMLENWG